MSRCNKGFTLTEFLLGIVVFALALGFITPNMGCTSNFIKSREKAKEAETKSNIHSIQIALERFAVDTGGLYPMILYGGDATDTFAIPDSPLPPDDPEYEFWEGDVDVLLEQGYLAQYPRNPFAVDLQSYHKGRITTNPGANGFEFLEINPARVNIWASPRDRGKEYIRRNVGGKDGNLIWDISEGQRHPPWPIVVVPPPPASPTGYVNPVPDPALPVPPSFRTTTSSG